MGDNLVRLIIQEDFGDDAAKVAEVFLKHGEQTLPSVVKLSGIEFLQIKHIMIMLIKHNLVSFRLKPVQDPPVGYKLNEVPCKQFLYNLSAGDVIHRLRFPKMIDRMGHLFGTLCQDVLIEFLENGRLTMNECVLEINEHEPGAYSEDEIVNMIGILVKGSYLQSVGVVDEDRELLGALENEKSKEPELTTTGKRKAGLLKDTGKGKKSKTSKETTNMLDDGLDDLMMSRLNPKDKVLGIPTNRTEVSFNIEESKNIEEKITKTSTLFKDPITGNEHIFRVNFRKFIHDFRTKHVVDIVSGKLNTQAGWVVEAILKDSQLYTKASTFTLTEALSLPEIVSKVGQHGALKESSVKSYLSILEQEEIVKASSGLGRGFAASYSVNLKFLIHKLQHKTLESIVQEKLGEYEARVMRALDQLGFLDEKEISDTCLIPMKETRAALMNLITKRYLTREEITKDKSKTVAVYGLMPKQAIANLLEEMMKTMFNLKKRQSVEMDKLSKSLHADEEKARKLISKIEYAILELDDTIMLFNEY